MQTELTVSKTEKSVMVYVSDKDRTQYLIIKKELVEPLVDALKKIASASGSISLEINK